MKKGTVPVPTALGPVTRADSATLWALLLRFMVGLLVTRTVSAVCENSDVSLVARLVAVAVTMLPAGTTRGGRRRSNGRGRIEGYFPSFEA
jgi:hypothetical protein